MMKKYFRPFQVVLNTGLSVIGLLLFLPACAQNRAVLRSVDSLQHQIDLASQEINKRFINPQTGILYDYAGRDGNNFFPTPDECKTDKPNGLS